MNKKLRRIKVADLKGKNCVTVREDLIHYAGECVDVNVEYGGKDDYEGGYYVHQDGMFDSYSFFILTVGKLCRY